MHGHAWGRPARAAPGRRYVGRRRLTPPALVLTAVRSDTAVASSLRTGAATYSARMRTSANGALRRTSAGDASSQPWSASSSRYRQGPQTGLRRTLEQAALDRFAEFAERWERNTPTPPPASSTGPTAHRAAPLRPPSGPAGSTGAPAAHRPGRPQRPAPTLSRLTTSATGVSPQEVHR